MAEYGSCCKQKKYSSINRIAIARRDRPSPNPAILISVTRGRGWRQRHRKTRFSFRSYFTLCYLMLTIWGQSLKAWYSILEAQCVNLYYKGAVNSYLHLLGFPSDKNIPLSGWKICISLSTTSVNENRTLTEDFCCIYHSGLFSRQWYQIFQGETDKIAQRKDFSTSKFDANKNWCGSTSSKCKSIKIDIYIEDILWFDILRAFLPEVAHSCVA